MIHFICKPVITLKDGNAGCEAEIYAFGGLLNAFSIPLKGAQVNVIEGFVAFELDMIATGFVLQLYVGVGVPVELFDIVVATLLQILAVIVNAAIGGIGGGVSVIAVAPPESPVVLPLPLTALPVAYIVTLPVTGACH